MFVHYSRLLLQQIFFKNSNNCYTFTFYKKNNYSHKSRAHYIHTTTFRTALYFIKYTIH